MSTGTHAMRCGDFRFDPADGRLEHVPSGRAVTLRPQAGRLLQALLAAEGGVVAREALYRAVWDEGTVVDFEAGLAALVRELRQALDQLDGKAGLLETIPRRGYRLRVDPATGRSTIPAPARARRFPRWAWLVAAAAAVALAFLGWWLLPGQSGGGDEAAPPAGSGSDRALAVLPFQAFGQPAAPGPRLELLLADAFLSELWRAELPGVQLVGRATLTPYGDREDVAPAVARDLGVQLLVEGSLVRTGDDWQVTARLLAMPGGRVLWSETVSMPAEAQPPVAQTVAALAASVRAAWPAIARDLPSN